MQALRIVAVLLAASTTSHALVIKQGDQNVAATGSNTSNDGNFDREKAAAEVAAGVAELKAHQIAGQKLTTQSICAPRLEVKGAEDLQRQAMAVYYLSTTFRPDALASDGIVRLAYENTHGQRLRYSAHELGWMIDGVGMSGDGKAILWSKGDKVCPSLTTDWQVFKHNDASGAAVWTTASDRISSGKNVVEVLPITVYGCPETITITGQSTVEAQNKAVANKVGGTYTIKQSISGPTHRGRPIYENAEGTQLYYWGADDTWLLGQSSNTGDGVAKASSSAECPQDAKGWFAYDAKAKTWSSDSALAMSEVAAASKTSKAAVKTVVAEASKTPKAAVKTAAAAASKPQKAAVKK